jgi:hypothetical protein
LACCRTKNLRHNPAQIPVFDPLLAAWLLLGVGLATLLAGAG